MRNGLLLAALIVSGSASTRAEVLHFEVTSSPTDAVIVHDDVLGHVASAGICGGFTVEVHPPDPVFRDDATLRNFDLRLVDVIQVNPAFVQALEWENAPLQDLLPVDFEMLSGIHVFIVNAHDWTRVSEHYFFPGLSAPTTRSAMMDIELHGNVADIRFEATPSSATAGDGVRLAFKSLTAAVVPEPSTFVIVASSLWSLAALQRRLGGVMVSVERRASA